MATAKSTSHIDLQAVAKQIMQQYGFEPDFSPEAQQQLGQIKSNPPQVSAGRDIRDLRNLLWSSIDNDTSRDLDQIEVAESLPGGKTRILIGIADVDAFVAQNSPIDQHAAHETTSVYAGCCNFMMLPEDLSTGVTSLLEGADKICVVAEYSVDGEGQISSPDIYRALVRNKAQLAYNSVGAWLEGRAAAPPKVAASTDLQAQLKLQDQVAQALKNGRHQRGALDIETIELHPIILQDQQIELVKQERNHATELIEDFMIAANGVVATALDEKHVSAIRRVVKTPERWDRIVALAAEQGGKLPAQPDSKALNYFLQTRRATDPDHFADLSLAVIKLMGPGEYVLEKPGEPSPGHFALAVQSYTHSTAPNRRFADMVMQRLLKAMLTNSASPYSDSDLAAIAQNCTQKEDAAKKVERAMSKRIAAISMSSRIGQLFDAIVTGVTGGGTFVRVLLPHVEGLLVHAQGLDVGDRVRVKLIRTDPQQGYIDFARA